MYIYVHKYTYCRARVCVYDIIGTYIYIYVYLFHSRVLFYFSRGGRRRYIISCQPCVRFVCICPLLCIYTHPCRKDFISNLLKRYFIPGSEEYPLSELIFLRLSLSLCI